MNFESQICTTHKQSERLLSLGLKLETADMVYHYTKSKVPALEWELKPTPPTLRGKFWTPQRIAKLELPFHKHPDGTPMTGEEAFDEIWVGIFQHGAYRDCWKCCLMKFQILNQDLKHIIQN